MNELARALITLLSLAYRVGKAGVILLLFVLTTIGQFIAEQANAVSEKLDVIVSDVENKTNAVKASLSSEDEDEPATAITPVQ